MPCYPHVRHLRGSRIYTWMFFSLLMLISYFYRFEVFATPGQATHLGGPEAQGPATPAITAVHHNPAMLASIPYAQLMTSSNLGFDQRWIRRHLVDAEGLPRTAMGSREALLNPLFNYFIAGNLYFDPVAIAVGVYSLGNQFYLNSTSNLRYHLAPDPDTSALLCRAKHGSACPYNGGATNIRTDFTLAIAWRLINRLNLGVSLHFPRLRTSFSYDNSTATLRQDQLPEGTLRCAQMEDPECDERFGFRGRTHWLPATRTRPSGFNLMLTLGLSVDINDRITLGARYRTRPLLNGGELQLGGQSIVCRPEETTDSDSSGLPSCSQATPIATTLDERVSQEAALGLAAILGRSKLWRLDTNLYWMDLCADAFGQGIGIQTCANPGSQEITLIGLNQVSVLSPEFIRYRGYQDLFGADIFASYQIRRNILISFAGHTNSPAVRSIALAAGNSDGWRVGASVGTTLRLGQSNFQLITGYGLDMYVPTHVRPQEAAFNPAAAQAYANAFGDLNIEAANLVLEGRGRPSNAGTYSGLSHTFTLGLRWAERTLRN